MTSERLNLLLKLLRVSYNVGAAAKRVILAGEPVSKTAEAFKLYPTNLYRVLRSIKQLDAKLAKVYCAAD